MASFDCEELIAQTKQEYVDIAIRLGVDKTYLETLRSKIWSARHKCPLFDSENQANELEKLYMNMWMKHQKNLKPENILS